MKWMIAAGLFAVLAAWIVVLVARARYLNDERSQDGS